MEITYGDEWWYPGIGQEDPSSVSKVSNANKRLRHLFRCGNLCTPQMHTACGRTKPMKAWWHIITRCWTRSATLVFLICSSIFPNSLRLISWNEYWSKMPRKQSCASTCVTTNGLKDMAPFPFPHSPSHMQVPRYPLSKFHRSRTLAPGLLWHHAIRWWTSWQQMEKAGALIMWKWKVWWMEQASTTKKGFKDRACSNVFQQHFHHQLLRCVIQDPLQDPKAWCFW